MVLLKCVVLVVNWMSVLFLKLRWSSSWWLYSVYLPHLSHVNVSAHQGTCSEQNVSCQRSQQLIRCFQDIILGFKCIGATTLTKVT